MRLMFRTDQCVQANHGMPEAAQAAWDEYLERTEPQFSELAHEDLFREVGPGPR